VGIRRALRPRMKPRINHMRALRGPSGQRSAQTAQRTCMEVRGLVRGPSGALRALNRAWCSCALPFSYPFESGFSEVQTTRPSRSEDVPPVAGGMEGGR
jgi:hypothetical protein